jgi:hypothetical protein
MQDTRIPEGVRRLIADRIDSIPELEALLLFRDNRERGWTAEDAGKRLYVSTLVAGYILGILSERGFFSNQGEQYLYAPESPELAAAVDQLATSYSRHLVAVTEIVHSKPSRNVLAFADAFRLRKAK